MPKIVVMSEKISDIKTDFEIIFVVGKNLDHKFVRSKELLQKMDFEGADESVCLLVEKGEIYVGVEKPDSESFRIASSQAIRAIKNLKIKTAKVALCENLENSRAIIEGLMLASYEFDKYKSKPKKCELENILISTETYSDQVANKNEIEALISYTEIATKYLFIARDLVNTTPNDMTPQTLADEASKIAKDAGVECKIYDEKYLSDQKMGAFYAVGKASTNQPRLIHLSYKPKNAVKKVALVGKGLTYDSGGLSLKPSDYMTTMKADMSGGAAVLAIIAAAKELDLPVEIEAVVGAAENMVSGSSYKPDDVLVAKNGKTIEVKNTDAEGRLVLADCLCFAQELGEFDYIVDLATLTGACVVALGEYTSGVMGFDDGLKHSLIRSAKKSGELASTLPFNRHLKKLIKSEIADVCNISSSRYGGAITAAMFLAEFVEEKNRKKWAHLDIAGPAFVEKSWGSNPFGASGAGVLWVLEWLKELKNVA